MEKEREKSSITEDQLIHLFGNLEELFRLSTAITPKLSEYHTIGKTFFNVAPLLQNYGKYLIILKQKFFI